MVCEMVAILSRPQWVNQAWPKPLSETILTKIYWFHMASLGHNESTRLLDTIKFKFILNKFIITRCTSVTTSKYKERKQLVTDNITCTQMKWLKFLEKSSSKCFLCQVCLNFILITQICLCTDLTENHSALVQTMATHRIGNKPLSETITTQFNNAIQHHSSLGPSELKVYGKYIVIISKGART